MYHELLNHPKATPDWCTDHKNVKKSINYVMGIYAAMADTLIPVLNTLCYALQTMVCHPNNSDQWCISTDGRGRVELTK